MSGARMMAGNMFDRAVSSRLDNSASVFPLPLNLIALIISFVCKGALLTFPWNLTNGSSLTAPPISHEHAERAECFITSHCRSFTATSAFVLTITYALVILMVVPRVVACQARYPWA